MIVRRLRLAPVVALAASAGAAVPLTAAAQDGPGTAGAQVLHLPAGSRAAAFSGAYTAITGDPAVLFYNPAGTATLVAAAGVSYQRYVEDISLGSVSGAVLLGPVVVSAGALFLDAGEIEVIEPDPAFGGERGRTTGETAGASESAARLGVAMPFMDGRVRVGGAAGFVSSELAGLSRGTATFDLGAQAALPYVTIGGSLRNIGGSLSGDGTEIPLPGEARLGAAVELADARGLGATLAADLVSALQEGGTSFAAGLEAGLLPGRVGRFSAVGRIGYDGTASGDDALGPLRFGAGVSVGDLAFDYTYQNLDFFGAVHRVGVRWVRSSR